MTHTPGPWIFCRSPDACPHNVFVGKRIGSIEVKHYGYDDPNGEIAAEQMANARLIAAAPDLLEALKIIKDCSFEGSSDLFRMEALLTVIERLQGVAAAAIAKAEGRTND